MLYHHSDRIHVPATQYLPIHMRSERTASGDSQACDTRRVLLRQQNLGESMGEISMHGR
jgi:hypothetical protein